MAWECCCVPEGTNPSGAHTAHLPAASGKGGWSASGIRVTVLKIRVWLYCGFFFNANFLLVSS